MDRSPEPNMQTRQLCDKCIGVLDYLDHQSHNLGGAIFGSVVARIRMIRANPEAHAVILSLLVDKKHTRTHNDLPGPSKDPRSIEQLRLLRMFYQMQASYRNQGADQHIRDIAAFYNTLICTVKGYTKRPDVDIYFPSREQALRFGDMLGDQVCSSIASSSRTYNHLCLIRFNVLRNGCALHIEVSYPFDDVGNPPSDSLALLDYRGVDVNPVFAKFFQDVDTKAVVQHISELENGSPNHSTRHTLVMYALDPILCAKYFQSLACRTSVGGVYNKDGSIRYSEDDPFIRMVQNMLNRLVHILSRFGPDNLWVPQFQGIEAMRYSNRWTLSCGHIIDAPRLLNQKFCISIQAQPNSNTRLLSATTECPVCFHSLVLFDNITLLTDPGRIHEIHEDALTHYSLDDAFARFSLESCDESKGELSDVGPFDGCISGDNHSDDNHSDDNHSDDNHSDDNHSDDNHSDDNHSDEYIPDCE
jgi:hypothetical protein